MVDRRRYVLASKLFGSGMVAQLCGFAATAYAASRTTPGEFALFGAVMATSAVIGSVNSLAAESRVPVVPRATAEALNRSGFGAIVAFTALALVAGVMGLWRGEVWGQVAVFSAWASFMLGVQHLFIGIILRSERQELLARNRLVQGIGNALLIVALVLIDVPGFLALSYAWGASMTISNLVLVPQVKGWGPAFGRVHADDWRRLFDQVRWQPLSNVLSDAVGQIPLIVLPALGSPAISGAWAAASRFLMPVVNMAQITLQPIYYGRAAALLRAGDPAGYEAHRRIWGRGLLLLSIPVAVGCFVAVEWLIPLLGPEWRVASLVVLPACILFPTTLGWLPISQTLILSGHLRAQLVWTIVQFVLTVVPFTLAAMGYVSAYEALLAWSLVSAGGVTVHRLLQRRPPILQEGWDGVD